MKSWFLKWKISAALDSGWPLTESLRRKIAADPELQRFTQRAEALGQTLRSSPLSAPPLHNDIMNAVRSAAHPAAPRRMITAPTWWVVSGAAAALAVVCLYLGVLRPQHSQREAMDGPVMVLEISENMSTTVPTMVVSPLSNEWARVDHDLQNTTQVLLASLP